MARLRWTVRHLVAALRPDAAIKDICPGHHLHDGLQHWQKGPDLAGIRDPDGIAALPADEQEACKKLWADVAALLKKVGQAK